MNILDTKNLDIKSLYPCIQQFNLTTHHKQNSCAMKHSYYLLCMLAIKQSSLQETILCSWLQQIPKYYNSINYISPMEKLQSQFHGAKATYLFLNFADTNTQRSPKNEPLSSSSALTSSNICIFYENNPSNRHHWKTSSPPKSPQYLYE